jgi:hypothetical protein
MQRPTDLDGLIGRLCHNLVVFDLADQLSFGVGAVGNKMYATSVISRCVHRVNASVLPAQNGIKKERKTAPIAKLTAGAASLGTNLWAITKVIISQSAGVVNIPARYVF